MKANEVNLIKKGEVLFVEGDDVEYIGMVMKGKIKAKSVNFNLSFGAGSFIGLNDLVGGKYICDYLSEEDASVYVIQTVGITSLSKVLSLNKDYRGLAVFYLDRFIYELDKSANELMAIHKNLCDFAVKKQSECMRIGKSINYKFPQISQISSLSEFEPSTKLDTSLLGYYLDNVRVNPSILKEYFGASEKMTVYHILQQAPIINQIIELCGEYEDAISEVLSTLVNDQQSSLLFFQSRMALSEKASACKDEILKEMKHVVDTILLTVRMLAEKTGINDFAHKEVMERIFTNTINGQIEEVDKTHDDYLDEKAQEEAGLLTNSLNQIFEFADYPSEEAEQFKQRIEEFIACEDKLSTDETMRRIRREIEKGFINLYENVFIIASQSDKIPKVVRLFLNYGFVDERLLSRENLVKLCALSNESSEGPCKVYYMYEWLLSIYKGKNDPSRDELGVDYIEFIRQQKRQGKISEKDEAKKLKNGSMRVSYEIHNAFSSACRVTHGQFSIYVPILFDDIFLSSIEKVAITKKDINDMVTKLLNIDYSVFHRETLYVDEARGIEKEYIMKQVFPNIIITPIAGIGASMWQDITGKKRDTPGRFFVPAFCQSKLENVMAKLFGNFRWELCKTIQGVNWNNYQIKSLTSEYTDYIQFYKKNHDISEERKEKIKLQIQRNRNNMRDVFTSDYEVWLLAESNGAIRLNKVVRELIATYCPFKKSIRTELVKQPTFEEAFVRFERERHKKLKDLDLRHRSLERTIKIPKVMIENMNYYKDN